MASIRNLSSKFPLSSLRKSLIAVFADTPSPDHHIRLQPLRKIRLTFLVSIATVLVAAIFTLTHTAFRISANADLYFFKVPFFTSTPSGSFRTDLQRVWAATPCHNQSACPDVRQIEIAEDDAPNRFIMVLDFWERMINVQSSLHRLVLLGVDAGFTVVEPFFFESKVSPYYSFPEQFEARNMVPQPATLYFRTEDLYNTNRYVSHMKHREQIRLVEDDKAPEPQYVIQAAVEFDWTPPTSEIEYSSSHESFRWCDDVFTKQRRSKSPYGWLLAKNVHAQRVLCVTTNATQSPSRFSAGFFDDVFRFVEEGTQELPRNCENCVTLAFLNYRKHAFTGYVSSTGVLSFQNRILPLSLGTFPRQLASRVRRQLFQDRPYVAMQMRTGKAFVYFDNDEKRKVAQGITVNRHKAFGDWMKNCTAEVVLEAKRQAKLLGKESVFFIASDMYNNGWKGGETAPFRVQTALNDAKQSIKEELKEVFWFIPKDFGISQDSMGISGLLDAAMCIQADRFVYAQPSNFGNWVAEQRVAENVEAETKVLNCVDSSFKDR